MCASIIGLNNVIYCMNIYLQNKMTHFSRVSKNIKQAYQMHITNSIMVVLLKENKCKN